MPDEPLLREKARAAIRAGKLPSRRPDRTWGGPGIGEPCTICGEPIRRDQLEFEIQLHATVRRLALTGIASTSAASRPGSSRAHRVAGAS